MQIAEYDKVSRYLRNSISKLVSEIGAIKIGNTQIYSTVTDFAKFLG